MRHSVVTAVLVLALSVFSYSQSQEKILWSFGGAPNDGSNPVSSLIADSLGNLYGTTNVGGVNNAGIVFELSPQSDGTWNESVLYNFCSQANCTDGEFPLGALVLDGSGNLIGTTQFGGTQSGCQAGFYGCGTVFELSPQIGGTWTETVLYNFCSVFEDNICEDGSGPNSQLTFDSNGNLYGTSLGGVMGVVFELSPEANGWTESVLYHFCPSGGNFCRDGSAPRGGVAFDNFGNLYGTTQHGGRYRLGVVFELTPNNGSWSESVLISFFGYGNSVAPISFDAAGNPYGTTQGNVFRLNIKTKRQDSRTFTSSTGASNAGVLVDATRNTLFGVGFGGGTIDGGTVWEVNPARQLVPIYNFCSLPNCGDGGAPEASLIEDGFGNLYGTTKVGGAYGNGVVFELTP